MNVHRVGFGAVLSVVSLLLGAAQAVSQEAPVRENIRVDVIRVPIWARDRSGGSVTDLIRSDLRLTVDGRPVDIETIEAGGLSSPSTAPSSPGYAPREVGERRDAIPPELPVETFILIDESNAGLRERRDSFDELDRYLAASRAPRRILVAVFRRGRLHVLCPWTNEREAARKVLESMRKHPYLERDLRFLVTNRPELSEFQFVRVRLLATLLEALASFPDRPARRQLLFVTGGRTFASPIAIPSLSDEGSDRGYGFEPSTSAISPSEQSRNGFELWSRAVGALQGGLEDQDVVAKAMERDVVLIPIGVAAAETLGDIGKKTLRESAKRPLIGSDLEAAQALKRVGVDTGGDLIPRPHGAAKALAALDSRGGMAITFRDPFAGDHRLHRVVLASSRPGIALSYRRGYRISSDDERIFDAVLAGFQERPAGPGAMALEASIAQVDPVDGRPVTLLRLRFSPPRSSSDTADRTIHLIAAGRSAEGSWTAPVRWSGTARASDAGGFEAAIHLKTAPAAFTWSIAVRDAATGLVDYTLVPAAAN